MTEDEAKQVRRPSTLPWNEPCVVFTTGRYYHSLNFVAIPPGRVAPQGADVLVQFWRFDDEPDRWVVTMRFRYYVTDDPWDGKDRKSWRSGRFSATDAEIDTVTQQMLDTISGAYGLFVAATPPEIDRLIFKGNSDHALETMVREKRSWMHMKTEPQ